MQIGIHPDLGNIMHETSGQTLWFLEAVHVRSADAVLTRHRDKDVRNREATLLPSGSDLGKAEQVHRLINLFNYKFCLANGAILSKINFITVTFGFTSLEEFHIWTPMSIIRSPLEY